MDPPPASLTPPAPESKPGTIRTWWHPLLASFLRWQLGSHFQLEEELPVGQMPLKIDVLLLRRLEGDLPAHAQQVLAGLAEYLNDYTLLEFKSPSETLRAGDFQTFVAYSLLYRVQTDPLLDPSKLHLVVIAPRLTKPYRDELDTKGVTAHEEQPGVWRLQGGVLTHRTWLLETEKLAGQSHPLLTLFSPQFLHEARQTYAQLRQVGYTELVVYLAQQVQQFKLQGEAFAMQHLGAEDEMNRVLCEILYSLPVEQRVALLSEREILEHFSVDKLLANIPLEQLLQVLSAEQREELRKLLARKDPEDSAGPK